MEQSDGPLCLRAIHPLTMWLVFAVHVLTVIPDPKASSYCMHEVLGHILVYYGYTIYLDMGFETLTLKWCESNYENWP